MKIRIEIELDNSAFDDPGELARVLKTVKPGKAKLGPENLRDSNGNTVGHYELLEN